jgi:hypothetical protein
MFTINDEELQQLDEEYGVTIHDSVDALYAYELSCITPDSSMLPCSFTVQPVTKQSDATVQAYY